MVGWLGWDYVRSNNYISKKAYKIVDLIAILVQEFFDHIFVIFFLAFINVPCSDLIL